MTMMPRGGKGDRYRKVDDKKYNENWDRIFGNAKTTDEDVKNVSQDTESIGKKEVR